ncbi:unnamed protein product [Mytilus edulis]|uniref:Uncharacterized protein n=1 Tax=Mytilus edulis TaxID=6550 RepID=A0A8S3UZP0_MYTED|nr:unnamed protein product [Mytilus edulis]
MIDSDSLVIDSPIGKSDHAVIHFDYNCYLSFEQDTSERFQYFKGDYKAISDELDQENWDVLFEDKSIEQIWNIFKSKLSQCIEKYIPKRRHCNKFTNPPMWMDRRTKSAIIKKRRAWKKYQFSRSRVSYTNYASSRNNCTNTIREAKKSYERKVALEAKTNFNEQQHQDLQDDLDRLCDWSRKWKLSFNASKCKVMHFGQNNNLSRYTMLDNEDDYVQVNPVTEEKDLGITFEPNLKFDKHITNCVNKAQRVLALIRISFDYLEKDMFIILYKSIIRPLLEYSTTVWSPYLKKDIRRIEKIQRRATKLVPSIKMLSYVERLRALGLPTLEYRRDRYDMIQVYKALHGIDDIKWQNMFELSTNSTRGHPWKLSKKRCNSTQRLHSFSQRIIDQWNSLSTVTVCAESVNIFKNHINDEHWNGKKLNPT